MNTKKHYRYKNPYETFRHQHQMEDRLLPRQQELEDVIHMVEGDEMIHLARVGLTGMII